ncbi:acylphosphatase [bacterium]|nr:acylphosphatase [bacterium]
MLAKILVEGIVQGVGYRYFVKQSADRLNLVGFVKNLENGSVYVEAVGSESKLRIFIEELKVGTRFADVRKVDVNFGLEERNFGDFRITC